MQCIVRLRFLNIFQLCDPCFRAVKLQKVEIEEEQAPSSTMDRSLMQWGAFIILVLVILIGLISRIISKENFLSNFFSTNSKIN